MIAFDTLLEDITQKMKKDGVLEVTETLDYLKDEARERTRLMMLRRLRKFMDLNLGCVFTGEGNGKICR